jgi:predicted permease
MGRLFQDLRYGARMLRRAPGFTAVAVLTLALGIGVNTAMFSIVNGVLLRGLPFPEPERLIIAYSSAPQFEHMSSSYLNFLDWARRSRSFTEMAAFRSDSFNLTGQGEPERVSLVMVSAPFFRLLGIQPVLGRTFTHEEDRRHAAPVIVLGTHYWKQRFGGDPAIVGRSLVLNGTPYTVIGVASSDIGLYRNVDAFMPIGNWNDEIFWDRAVSMGMNVVGRLRPGVTAAQAQADMSAIAASLAREYPKENKDKGIALVPMRENLVGDVRSALLVLLAAVGFVLLIACANVANLLLARSAARRREFAIRGALGAGRTRLVRQVLTESLLLAALGAAVGLALARALTDAFVARVGDTLPPHAVVGLDGTVLAFTAALSILASLVFAAAPAWQSARADVNRTLKEGGRGSSRRHGLQRALVVGEIALALLLTAAAGLMVRTMWSLWQVDPGFDPRNVLTFSLAGAPTSDVKAQALRDAYTELEARMRRLPGIQAVSTVAGSIPMTGDSELPFWIVGEPHPEEQSQLPWALFYVVSPEYQKALGLRLIRGRFIDARDTEHAPYSIVIDEELARLAFPSKDPLAERLHLPIVNADYQIVGIVGHVRHWGLERDTTAKIRSQMYIPFRQLPDAIMPAAANGSGWVLRTTVAPGVMAEQVKRAVFQFNPNMTMYGRQTMEEIINDSLAQKRLVRLLLASFAGLALLLAAIGIYGVMSQLVLQSAHDIGVRIALGAAPQAVRAMVLRNAMVMAVAGIGVGAVAALAATRLMSSMLYGVGASDPLTFVSVAAVLGGVAMLASYLPARRATKVDPIVVLRYE